jgi:cold shock CspA family protein
MQQDGRNQFQDNIHQLHNNMGNDIRSGGIEMMNGKVRSLPEGKSFGFIESNDKDYFFHKDDFNGHWADLLKDFRSGKPILVEFEPTQSAKGLRAASVARTQHPDEG